MQEKNLVSVVFVWVLGEGGCTCISLSIEIFGFFYIRNMFLYNINSMIFHVTLYIKFLYNFSSRRCRVSKRWSSVQFNAISQVQRGCRSKFLPRAVW